MQGNGGSRIKLRGSKWFKAIAWTCGLCTGLIVLTFVLLVVGLTHKSSLGLAFGALVEFGQKTTLHSSAPVEVPILMPDGSVHINGALNGKPQRFVLDTGASAVQLYSKTRTGWFSIKVLHNESVEIVPSIQIGGLVVTSVPVASTNRVIQEPLLGDSFFRNIVLTIDYTRMIAQFRPSRSKPPRSDRAIVLPNAARDSLRWMPITTLNIGGSDMECLIDTGSARSCIDVDAAEFKNVVGEELKVKGNGAMGKLDVYTVKHPLSVLAAGRRIGAIRMGIKFPPNVHALIGNDILKNFRVTIDYPNGITYLEPYGKVDVTGH